VGNNLSLLLLHALFPVFLVYTRNYSLTMLCDCSFHLTVNFHLSESLFLTCLVSDLKDASVIFAVEVALP